MKFDQRVAVVTGAGGGIGRAICRQLHTAGVAIAATDSTLERAERAVAEIADGGAAARAYRLDVCDTASAQEASRAIVADFGKVDILINNAGVWMHPDGQFRRLTETREADWHALIEINLCGVFRVTQAFLPIMEKRRYGRIVNLGSIAGEVGLPGMSDYSAAKAGVIIMTKALAMETAAQGITVNCVSPGMVSSTDGEPTPNEGTWLGRCGRRDEIAEMIVYLASDSAAFITGVDYTVDGGRILGPKTVAPQFASPW